MLASLGIAVKIWPMPVEIPNPIRFTEDRTHASYDPKSVERLFQIGATETVAETTRAPVSGRELNAIRGKKSIDGLAFQIVGEVRIEQSEIVRSDAHGNTP